MPTKLTLKTLSTQHILAFLGAALLYAGLFAPVLDVPIFGELSYSHFGDVEGWIILALLVAAVLLTAANMTRWTWVPALGCAACVAFTAWSLWQTARQTQEDIRTRLAGNWGQQLAQVALDSVEVRWGWALLVAGVVLLLLAAAVARHKAGAAEAVTA